MSGKKKKVMQFIGSLGDGGAETLVKDYALLLDKEKFEVVIVVLYAPDSAANMKRLREQEHIRIISIYSKYNLPVKVFNRLCESYVSWQLGKIIEREKPDVLHVHLELLRYVYAIAPKLEGIQLFHTCHNVPEYCYRGRHPKEEKAARYLLARHGLQLIALHDDMAEQLNAMFGADNTVVIRNGIDFNRFRSVPVLKEEKRAELGIPQNAFVVGHVGRFAEQKNHPFLVEVFREVAAREPNAYLLMVGAGDTSAVEGKLKEYGLADRYQILSHRTDVNEIMRTMDVFVFPSLYEGLSVTMIEAQVSGLRCIVADTVNRETFKTDDAVALPLEEPAKWADVIFDNSVKGTATGSLDDYDMNKEIKRLEQLYLN